MSARSSTPSSGASAPTVVADPAVAGRVGAGRRAVDHVAAALDVPSDAELERRIDEHDRASEWTGPVGTIVAGLLFVFVSRDVVPAQRIVPWIAAILIASVAVSIGVVYRRRTRVGLPGFVLTGAAWGVLPLLSAEQWSVGDREVWTALAFQFATTAAVLGGTNVDIRPARLVVATMWGSAAFALVLLGRPVLALGALAFVVIVDRDLRNSSDMVRELVELRSSAAARAREAAGAALLDPMTGLMNRAGMERALAAGPRYGAAMFVDLDRFKDVNDVHGHHVGDRVLAAASRRLRGVFRDEDLVARVGGDEFVVVLAGDHGPEVLLERAAEVIRVLEEPVELDGELVLCSASVGVAVVDGNDVDLDRVLRESDHAMYDAKRTGRRRAVMFDDALRRQLDEHAELSTAVRGAVHRGEIEVWGQPVVVAADRSVFGIELLARWCDANGEWVPPSRFIPVAEAIGVASEITRTVLGHAVVLAARWRDHPVFGDAKIGVNVTGVDLCGGWLVDEIVSAAAREGVDPARLVIEITESESLHDDAEARRCLRELHELGVSIALDDFGTGYSSITSLVQLPIDVVKLDRSLTLAATDPAGGDVIRAIAALAGAIGRYVLAEGVETETEASMLTELGFQFAQGHLYGRAMPIDELEAHPGLRATAATDLPPDPGNCSAPVGPL